MDAEMKDRLTQGRMQHWQSSPHQHGSLTGGFTALLLLLILAFDPALVAEEVVDGGIVA